MGFRGGTRMEMACGGRALSLLNTALDQNRQVSQAFSAHWTQTGAAARRMNEVLEQETYRCTQLQRQILLHTAEGYAGQQNVLHFAENLDTVLVRELADAIADRISGTAAVFSGSDEAGYSYCLVTRSGDLRSLNKAMNAALNGRGGGKPNFQQGKVAAAKKAVEDFFAELF
jgi:alanyl-tRNA synthetase